MAHKYKTHRKSNPCRRVGFNSKFSDNPTEITCMWCLESLLTENSEIKIKVYKEILKKLEKIEQSELR